MAALLRQDAESGGLIGGPLSQTAHDLLTPAADFSSGSMVGPYRIGAQLGAGGMGQVYQATDTRLGRTVAIKTLKDRFTDRFEREARAISALNHPHVCTLHDIGSESGVS